MGCTERKVKELDGLAIPAQKAYTTLPEGDIEGYLYRAAAVETCRRLRGMVLPGMAAQPCSVRDTKGALVTVELFVTDFVANRMHYEKILGKFFKAVALRDKEALTFEQIGKAVGMSKAGAFKLLQKLPYPAGGRKLKKADCQHCSRKAAKYGLCPVHYALAIGIAPLEGVLEIVEVLY